MRWPTVIVAIQVRLEVGGGHQLRDVLFLAGAVTHTCDGVRTGVAPTSERAVPITSQNS